MANEATINAGLTIKVGNIDYQSRPTQFRGAVISAFGPAPGTMVASTDGIDVDLSKFTTPAYGWIQNLDANNYVTIGVFDPSIDRYFPLYEVGPGECYPFRLSRLLGQEIVGITGTAGADATTLRVKAMNAPCNIRVEVFEA